MRKKTKHSSAYLEKHANHLPYSLGQKNQRIRCQTLGVGVRLCVPECVSKREREREIDRERKQERESKRERLWFWSLDMCQQTCKRGPWQTHTGPKTHIQRFVTHPWGRSVQCACTPVSHSFTYIKMSLRCGAVPADMLISVTACVDFHTHGAAKSWILRVKTKMWWSQQTMTPASLLFPLKGKLFYFLFCLQSQAEKLYLDCAALLGRSEGEVLDLT